MNDIREKPDAIIDRITRARLYAAWILEDTESLLYQLRGPATKEQTDVLNQAKVNVRAALDLIEHRIQNVEKADVIAS
jgi:hypothetical protein